MDCRSNLILGRLDEHTSKQIASSLDFVQLGTGQILANPLERIQRVYFPLTAVVSFVVQLSNGPAVEAGMVGRDGVVGAEAAIHDSLAFDQVIVQVPGAALVVSTDRFKELHAQYEALRNEVAVYRSIFVAQVQQSAACNGLHHIDARLCRWLLRLRDLAGDEFYITQEFVAHMLGVQRASVSVEAGKLREAGLVSYRRGHMKITDLAGLRNAACECYENLKKYERAALEAAKQLTEA